MAIAERERKVPGGIWAMSIAYLRDSKSLVLVASVMPT